jgi:hypothetical protein
MHTDAAHGLGYDSDAQRATPGGKDASPARGFSFTPAGYDSAHNGCAP